MDYLNSLPGRDIRLNAYSTLLKTTFIDSCHQNKLLVADACQWKTVVEV
jgi:hypothetical protein